MGRYVPFNMADMSSGISMFLSLNNFFCCLIFYLLNFDLFIYFFAALNGGSSSNEFVEAMKV
jgi:hypothetical protein